MPRVMRIAATIRKSITIHIVKIDEVMVGSKKTSAPGAALIRVKVEDDMRRRAARGSR